MDEPITYKIYLDKLTQHLLRVQCTISRPNENGQIVSFPAWVPGSYMIRDFAKHVVAIRASANHEEVALEKISKNTWACAPCSGPLIIEYAVYCFDLTARGAYVDHTRVFFDGCRVFLVIEGEEEQTRTVEIVRPNTAPQSYWRVATSMMSQQVDAEGFGKYVANNHLELIDHPFEISDFQSFEFVVGDVPHKIIISGKSRGDFARLAKDVQQICIAQMEFFGELPVMNKYVFILSLVAKGWGGIEHRASSSLVCTRSSLPKEGDSSKSDDYISLLGLFSHEYFHLWNVKRIKPEVFLNPNLDCEVYTRQLWIFEGITAYYDNLNMVRAQVLTPKEYLKILQDDLNIMLQTPGMDMQTLEESSFDAWIKYYQPDENSVNACVSYYLKGCLVALALDLLIIKSSKRKQSLADIMQVLWQQYGRIGLGLPENYFEHVTFEVTGEDYSHFFDTKLRSTEPLELKEAFESVGVIYKAKAPAVLDNLGIKVVNDQGKVTVRTVLTGSPAQQAALAPNDIIIAVNNFAVNIATLEGTITSQPIGELLSLHVIRNDILLELSMINPPLLMTNCELEFLPELTEYQHLSQAKWLGI